MSIENRGQNKWRFRIRKDGISYTQNFLGTEKEAKKAHMLFEADVARGQVGIDEHMKFVQLAQLMMDEYVKPNLRANTQVKYKNFYNNHILDAIGDMSISKIKNIHIQKLINEKSKTLNTSTIYELVSVLSCTFNNAIKWELLKDNPCRNVIKPKKPNKNYAELLSTDEIRELLNALENEENQAFRMICLVALYCGLRKGEALALTIDDIDFKENTISINKQMANKIVNGNMVFQIANTKTENSIRKVYMPVFLAQEIKKYINNMNPIPITKQLFVNQRYNTVYSTNGINSILNIFLKRNNLKPIKFHDFRHLNATMMINAGTNIVVVAKALGDTIDTISKTYIHSVEDVRKEASIQLGDFINDIKNQYDKI